MESIHNLISLAGVNVARNILESQVVYPKTVNLQLEKSMLNLTFNGNLKSVIMAIETDIDLKAVDCLKDCVEILKLVEEFKDSVLLSRADFLVIYKGGMDVVKLENGEKPNSGRSIYLEVNAARNELVRYIQFARQGTTGFNPATTALLVLTSGLAVAVSFLLARELRK